MTTAAAKTAETIGEMITTGLLFPSPTNPRKRFNEASIDELIGSIRTKLKDEQGNETDLEQGIIEPLIVRAGARATDRPVKNKKGETVDLENEIVYEIVCGERRWRAATKTGLETVPCIVRDLSDEQVLEMQIHENLHREDIHPMDEAYGYHKLREHLGCDLKELSLRVGKNEKYVANRLKLNTLIDEAQKDIEDGHLPLVYALEIAKCAPDAQKMILANAAYQTEGTYVGRDWTNIPVKGKMNPWANFVAWIQKNILWQLTSAPFDLKATNLRTDGLACVACPDRTGANASLFDGELVGKKDACLDPVCFRAKAVRLVEITREKVAHEASVETADVPMINIDIWIGSSGVLGRYDFKMIGKKPYKTYNGDTSDKTCDRSVTAVNIGDGQHGKTYTVCLKTSACKLHFPGQVASKPVSAKSAEKEREKELDIKRQRREELFDCKVSEAVRQRVFRLAANKFVSNSKFTGLGDGFIPRLVAKLWWANSNNGEASNTRGMVSKIMGEITDAPNGQFNLHHWSLKDATKLSGKLSESNLAITLFLLVHGEKGHTYYDRWESQAEVKALAEEYGLNYRLLDAQVRLEIAQEKAKKHVEEFKIYLAAVEAGNEPKIPRPFSPNWKPKD